MTKKLLPGQVIDVLLCSRFDRTPSWLEKSEQAFHVEHEPKELFKHIFRMIIIFKRSPMSYISASGILISLVSRFVRLGVEVLDHRLNQISHHILPVRPLNLLDRVQDRS